MEQKAVRTKQVNDKKRDLSASISTKIIMPETIDLTNKNEFARR